MQGDRKYGTKLSTKEEQAYRAWRSRLPKNLQYEGDYDLRGLWKENPNVRPSANLHFPDKYKLPNHPTFSDESKYFNEATRDRAGHWQETDSSWNYIPFNKNVKDTIVERKDGMKKPPNEDRAALDWLSSYVGSPMYKKRLANFYKYPDYIQRQRANVLKDLKLKENTSGSDTQYYASSNEVAMSPHDIKRLGANRQEALVHEASHATNKNREIDRKGTALNMPEKMFIVQRNKSILPDTRGELYEILSDPKRESRLSDGSKHDEAPSESKSDIDAFRFLLNQRRIYDAGTQDVTPEILKKAAKDPVIRKSFIYKRLKQNFDDEGLQQIMNKVAANKTKKISNLA